MQQEDYIKREIEKIGVVMSAIRRKVFSGNINLAITTEKQIGEIHSLKLRR